MIDLASKITEACYALDYAVRETCRYLGSFIEELYFVSEIRFSLVYVISGYEIIGLRIEPGPLELNIMFAKGRNGKQVSSPKYGHCRKPKSKAAIASRLKKRGISHPPAEQINRIWRILRGKE